MALHKSQHGWVHVETIDATRRVELAPYTPAGGTVCQVVGPHSGPTQFLLLENRRRAGFDDRLPGEGLLVWRVDLSRGQNSPTRPALQLVQADGHQALEMFLNQGDSGDPFPGSTWQSAVPDTGLVSTSFPGGPRSGVTLSDITLDPVTGVVGVTVTIEKPPAPAAPAAGKTITPEELLAQADANAAPATPAVNPLREVGAVPAEPTRVVAAGLANVLRKSRVCAAELEPLVRAVTPTPLDLQRKVLAAETGMAPLPRASQAGGSEAVAFAGGFADPSSFDGWWFLRYKANFGVAWDAEGRFEGVFDPARHLTPRGGRDYLYTPDRTDPFRFVRSTGERIQPGHMLTDGGSVPRAAWVIPDINPWAYIKAYLIRDWDFSRHHCDAGYGRLVDPVNLTLGEGIYTLMRLGEVATDWRKVEVVYRAVSSFVGRGVWDRQWEAGACPVALPGNDPPGTT